MNEMADCLATAYATSCLDKIRVILSIIYITYDGAYIKESRF